MQRIARVDTRLPDSPGATAEKDGSLRKNLLRSADRPRILLLAAEIDPWMGHLLDAPP